ncbi:MAG: DUF507 family protein [Nitrospirae bacterium]|nr:DUF507 family protein [Nitrospirota bacterium]
MPVIAAGIVNTLLKKEMVVLKFPKEEVIKLVDELMLEELMVEDRLNEEVRGILRQFESEIEKGRLDYRKLFELTKKKLVRERNLVL